MVTVSLGTDSEQGQQQYIAIDLQFLAQTRLSGAFINSDQSSVNNKNLDTETYALGLSSNQGEAFRFGVEFERWGQTDVVTTDTWRAALEYNTHNLSFSISPEQQLISIYLPSGFKFFETSSTGWGLGADLSVLDNILFSLGFIEYKYSRKIPRADQILVRIRPYYALFLLKLTSGFEKRRKTVGVSYQFSVVGIGLDWVQSTSVFDGEKTEIVSMNIDLPIQESWSVNLQFGKQSANANKVDDMTFGYLALSYYW